MTNEKCPSVGQATSHIKVFQQLKYLLGNRTFKMSHFFFFLVLASGLHLCVSKRLINYSHT